MKYQETKAVFLGLLGLDAVDTTVAYTPIPNVSLDQLWAAFKRFAHVPLDCAKEVFCFESYYHDELDTIMLSFMRNFYIPFDDDPDAYIPLRFQSRIHYKTVLPVFYKDVQLLVEVGVDLAQAAAAYIAAVESQQELWAWLAPQTAAEVALFQ